MPFAVRRARLRPARAFSAKTARRFRPPEPPNDHPPALTSSPPSIFSSSADPWEHVFWTGVGATAANLNAEWEAKLRKEVAELNKERSATNASFMESILKEK